MKTNTLYLLVILLGCCLVSNSAQNYKNWGSFDRLLVMQNFIGAIYPDLKNVRGLMVLRAPEFHSASGAGDQVDLIPCRPGSGVAGGSMTGQAPDPPCAAISTTTSEYLSIYVLFGRDYPITAYGTGGSFVKAKSTTTEQLIIDHPEWDQSQRIDALRRAKPQFGPEQKAEFLRTVPLDTILRFTGCHLDLSTATFVATRDEAKPYPPRASLVWAISGYRGHRAKPDFHPCGATFEPFEGKLLSIEFL